MKIISETSLENFEAWSGGRYTLDVLVEKGLCEQLEAIIDDMEPEEGWSDTAINDLLWFERDNIAEWLGFSDWEDLENGGEEEEAGIEEAYTRLHKCIEDGDDFHTFCRGCECSSCPFNTHCGSILKCEDAYNLMLEGYSFDEAVS